MPNNSSPFLGTCGKKCNAAAVLLVAALVAISAVAAVQTPAAAAATAANQTASAATLAPPEQLTLEKAIQLALAGNPDMVNSRQAKANAQREMDKAAAAYALHVSVESKPIASIGHGVERGVPFDYKKGSLRLNTGMSTIWGLGGSFTVTHNYAQGDTPSTSLNLSASAGLDPASLYYGSGRLNMAQQANSVTKAIWDLTAMEKQTVVGTIKTYWQLELDAQRLALTQANAAAKTAAHELALKQADKGFATKQEVLTALIDKRQAEIDLKAAQTAYQAGLASFALSLGLPENAFSSGSAESGSLSVLQPSGCVTTDQLVNAFDQAELIEAAVNSDLNVKKKELDLALTQMRTTGARLGMLPGIDVSAGYSVPDATQLSETDMHVWSIGFSITVPVLDGGARSLNLEGRQIELANAEKALQTARDNARRAMEQKLLAWERLRDGVELANLRLDKARMDEQVKMEHYKLGLISEQALADASRATKSAEIALQAAINAQFLAELEIIIAAGGTPTLAGKPLWAE